MSKEDVRRNHKHYSFSDDRGLYFPDNFAGPDDGRKNRPRYDIIHPITRKVCKKPSTGWRWDEERAKKALDAVPAFIHFGIDETTVPCRKTYLENVTKEPFASVFYRDGRAASASVAEILGDAKFDFPKTVEIIKDVIDLITNDEDVILDSFAGSGTTAHAVLELNKEDGGNRKFILVEQEDYANTITAERVRRVIKGVKTAKNEKLKEGTGGSFSYFELGNEIEMESILRGKNLPSFKEFARYLFYTATGEEFNEAAINEKTGFIGESREYLLYLHYQPNVEWLKTHALTLNEIKALPKFNGKKRVLFAPAKYVDDATLNDFGVLFSQLPFEIYKLQK